MAKRGRLPQPKPHIGIPATIAELQDLQDNEQVRRLVQVIVETLLTGKLASLVFSLPTLVSSQCSQTNSVIAPIQSPEASPRRAKKVTWRKGAVPKVVTGSSNQET